ncbi:hypothetical protein [Psychroflexus torquis]|nr:hypothetical protein [Psychroflexus torquis]
MTSIMELNHEGTKLWHINGVRHREDGPAVETWNGNVKEWWLNDLRHREDGPAETNSMSNDWWINGKRHREDGPAIEHWNGFKQWYINDVEYTEQDYKLEMRSRKLKQLL